MYIFDVHLVVTLLRKMEKQKETQVLKKMSSKKDGKITVSKKHRWKPGTVARREIRKFQKTTCNLIGALPFRRLVRELAQKLSEKENVRFTATAVEALQEAAEGYVVALMVDTGLLAAFKKHESICAKDIMMALRIRGERR
jgi:histone H3